MRDLKSRSWIGVTAAALGGVVWWLWRARRRSAAAPRVRDRADSAPVTPAEMTTAQPLPLEPPAPAATPSAQPVARTSAIRLAGFSRLEAAAALALTLAAIVIQSRNAPLPQTDPLRDTAFLSQFLLTSITGVDWSRLFAALLVPAVFVLGRRLDGTLTGLLAAGCVALTVWSGVLGASDTVYTMLAFFAAVGVWLLSLAWHPHLATLAVGAWLLLVLLVTWLISPLYAALALLLPVFNLLYRRGEDRRWRITIISTLLTLVLAAPFIRSLVSTLADADQRSMTGSVHPALTFMDALSSSLWLHIAASDPTAAHGLPDHPVFEPLTAAAFVTGLIAWVTRLYTLRRWADLFLPLALLILLLPSALAIEPPTRYPDLQRAALALPVSATFAGFGAASVLKWIAARLFPERHNKTPDHISGAEQRRPIRE